jgi:hypothetical protein
MNAAITWLFAIVIHYSIGLPFVFFAVMMAVQFVVVYVSYPETKGVTLEEMQKKLGIA